MSKQLRPTSEDNTYTRHQTELVQCIQLNQAVTVLGKISAAHDFDDFSIDRFPAYIVRHFDSQWIFYSNKQGFPPRMS